MQTHRFRPPLEAASADDGVVWSRTCDDARCLARCCWTSCWAPFSVWQPPCRSYNTSLSSPSQGSRRRRTSWSQRTAGSPQTSRPATTRIRCIGRSTIPRDFTLIDTRFCPDHAWQRNDRFKVHSRPRTALSETRRGRANFRRNFHRVFRTVQRMKAGFFKERSGKWYYSCNKINYSLNPFANPVKVANRTTEISRFSLSETTYAVTLFYA